MPELDGNGSRTPRSQGRARLAHESVPAEDASQCAATRKERAPGLDCRVRFGGGSESKRDGAEDESHAPATGCDGGDGGGRRNVALPKVGVEEHRVDSIDIGERRVREGLMEVGAVGVAHEFGRAAPAVACQQRQMCLVLRVDPDDALVSDEAVADALEAMGWVADERGLGGARALDGLAWDLEVADVWEAWVRGFANALAPQLGLRQPGLTRRGDLSAGRAAWRQWARSRRTKRSVLPVLARQ